MRRVKVTVGQVQAEFELMQDVAPETAAAFWDSLPVDERLTHARWAGGACWFKTDRTPIASMDRIEHPVASIYPGVMVVRPDPPSGVAEVLLSYGTAESRGPTGRTYATPVAQLVGDETALFAVLANTWAGGATQIRVERAS